MNPERWRQVKEIFHAALEREPKFRPDFLVRACGADGELRSEVESLLSAHEEEGSFIDSPALADLLGGDEAALKPGQQLGAYEIVSPLGRGGMGEVYLAQDRRLGRRVALKILPAAFTRNAARLRRFEQEARAASALNHPNIITIYEIGEAVGTHFIATEYVEGETLRQRLRRSQPDLRESLDVAAQIADALSAAHKAGIVHRDVKPENLMLRPDGYVKVLDFGLAKLVETPAGFASDPESPTRGLVSTSPGVVMGTINYMSPEQARGLDVDARTDIWSLGVVLYEMATGSDPFAGETQSDTLSHILQNDPPPLAGRLPSAPPELGRIVAKSLRKDREERYQVVKDLLIDLRTLKQELEFAAKLGRAAAPTPNVAARETPAADQETGDGGAAQTNLAEEARVTAGVRPARRAEWGVRRWAFAALAALVVLALGVGFYELRGRWRAGGEGDRSVAQVAPQVGEVTRVTVWPGLDAQPSLSPDGNSVAYSSDHNGTFEIYVKQLTPGGREIQLTSDGEQNFQPAWSPDGQTIAYYSRGRGGVWTIPALGGAARQLTDFGSAPAWSHDGKTLAFQSDSDPDLGSPSVGSSTIWTVASQGGAPRQITQIGRPAGGHVNPTWSPDDRRVAFVALNFGSQEVWSASLEGDVKQLTDMRSHGVKVGYPLYAPDGRGIYFVAGPTLWLLPISPADGAPAGKPVTVTDAGASVISRLTVSADGRRLAYSIGTFSSNIWSLPVAPKSGEPAGQARPLTNQTGTRNNQPAFSPDGRKLAFMEFLRGGGSEVWVADADGKNPAQVTTTSKNMTGGWFPDGDQMAIVSFRDKHWSVWATSLSSRRERPLYDIGRDIQNARLSPDGRTLAFNLETDGIINVWTVPLAGGEPRQLTFDRELAGFPCWSPDGKWLAYQLKRGDDAYVMLMPSDGGESVQLTSDHGRSWPYGFSPDGDRVVFAGERGGVWNVYWVSRTTKQEKRLTDYTKLDAFVRYPAWSPTGTQIAYEYAEMTGNIWTLDLK